MIHDGAKEESWTCDQEAKFLCELSFKGEIAELKHVANATGVNKRYKGGTPLMHAAFAPRDRGFECLLHLIRLRADITASDSLQQTAMHFAVLSSNVKIIQTLFIKNQSLISAKTKRGETPLMWAAALNMPDIVRLLMQLGAETEVRNINGDTAEDIAKHFMSWSAFIAIVDATKGKGLPEEMRTEILQREEEAKRLCFLIDRGEVLENSSLTCAINWNRRWQSRTPLMSAARAAENSGKDSADLMLKLGADPLLGDWQGWTAAHHAVWFGNHQVLKLLPQSAVDLLDHKGDSPLLLAAYIGDLSSVKILISKGVNISVRDCDDRSAVELAKSGDHSILAQVLEDAANTNLRN